MHKKNIESYDLVLLRGLTRASFHWTDFPSSLKRQLNVNQVFCLELPGNGTLHQQTTPALIDEAVEVYRSQLPGNVKKKGIIIFSISLGSMIANRWTEMYPDEIKGLILTNTSFSNLNPFYHRMRISSFLELIRTLWMKNPEDIERIILDRTVNNKEIQKTYLNKFVDFRKNHPISLLSILNQLRLAQQARFTEKPKCPTLIIASKKDYLISYKCSKRLSKKFNIPIKIHPSAGHDITLDDPEWVIQTLAEFFYKSFI